MLKKTKVGYEKIYACEMNSTLAKISEKMFKNFMPEKAHRIKIIEKYSTDLDAQDFEPNFEGFDVIVTEIFDSSCFGEKILSVALHAQQYLLKSDGIIIPSSINLFLTVIKILYPFPIGPINKLLLKNYK